MKFENKIIALVTFCDIKVDKKRQIIFIMTNPIFHRYGPGLLYGRNTIMAYLDDLTRVNCKAVEELTPNLNNQPKGKRQNLVDELKELEEIRTALKKSFVETLIVDLPQFPKIIEQTLPKLEAPFHILRDVIIPIIEQISTKTPESIPQFLETMNQFLTNNAPTEVWDVPEVSEKVTQWMKKALTMPNCDQVSILQFWLKFIKLRAKIEDVLVLASVWFEHTVPDDKLTLIPMLLSDIKLEMTKCTFLDFIENPTSPLCVSYNPIMIENLKPPSSLSEQPKRKCVAYGGFLYVMDADPKIGFCKFGTGKCGTIFGQTEIVNKDFVNRNPVSMAYCNGSILVHFADSPSNEIIIIDPATLKEVGKVENTEILPSGPFTAFKNTFYVVYQKSINSYNFDGKSLKFIKTTEIRLSSGETEFIPDAKLALANLFTDGIFMNVVFTPKDDSSANVISCSIETGDSIDTPTGNEVKLSPYISFDCLAKTLIMIPNWTQTSIYNYSERYNYQILFGNHNNTASSNNACLNLLNTIIPSSISKISPGIINYNRHYVLSSTKPLYDLIQLCFKDERYSVFLQPAIILLTIRYSEVKETPLITLDLLCSILTSDKINSPIKVALLRSLIKHGNSPLFDTLEKCSQVLEKLTEKEITEIFTETGFNDIFTFAISFLIKPYNKILQYAAENSKEAYPFISNLIFTILRGVLVSKCFSPTVIFPILEITTKCDKSVLPTIVPPLLPLIEHMTKTVLESKKYTDILLNFTSNLLQYASIIDLQSFANLHAESREKPKYFTKTTIEESPHPYDNDMRVVHNYDFPGAVELIIEFDKRTATENGCDYLQIFTDEEMKKELTPMMSGKYAKWIPIIKTQSQHLTFHFYSDTSITEWGYKATITARYVATRKFSSPESFFDLSYTIIDMLYNFTKRLIDEKRTKQTYPQFSIPREVIDQPKQLTESQKMILKTKLKENIDESIFNLPTTLPSFYSALDYLVNNNMYDKSLVDIILSPPDYIITETQDPKDVFTSLSSFIMTNNLCELPQPRFAFLTNVIKGTDDAHVFALNLIKKAQVVLQDSNPKNLLSAANYIQTAFKINNETILKEGKDVIGKFLNTLSHSCLPLDMPLVSSLIEKSHNLFTIVLPSLSDVAQFLQKACESLETIEPNPADKTIPFINFALSVILVLPANETSRPFITRLVLSSLKFNMPNVISLISQVVDKFNVHTNLKESPMLNELFAIIGKAFSTDKPTPTTTIMANLSPSLLISRAAILRRVIEPESISDLAPILEKQDDASFGALLVLAQRYLPPFPSQKVRLISNNKVVTLTGMDYQSYHLKTESGVDFSIPAANYNKFVFFNPPFVPILPSEFPKVSKELISAVEKCTTSTNSDFPLSLFAKCALAELSTSSDIDSNSIQWPTLTKPVEKQTYQVVESTISHFKHETGQVLYRMSSNSNCVTFIAQGQMTVGFSSKNSLSSAVIVPIKISNNYINFETGSIKFHFDSPEVTIGLYGPYKQVFIQSGKLFSFTQLFLGALEDPQPFFLTEEKPKLVVPNDFPSFLFYAKKAKSFSHVHSGERLYSINDDLYKPKKLNEVQFLPPLKTNQTKYIYLELSTVSRNVIFSLVNETIKSHILYQNKLDNLPEKASKTIGIYISFPDKEQNRPSFAFLTFEGQYIEKSAAKINLTECVSLFSFFDETAFTSINVGTKPFVFDVDNFMSKFSVDNLPTQLPFIDEAKIPSSISSIICEDKEPEDFMAPSNKFRSAPLERPIFIPSKNLVTSYIPSTQKESSDYTIDVYSDYISKMTVKSDKIISLTESLTSKKAQSIAVLERIQNSMPQFISPFLFFKSDKREETCQNLLTKKRKDSYFERINLESQFAIALNTISRYSAEKIDSFKNIEEFIINSAMAMCSSTSPFGLLNGYYNSSFGRILRTLLEKKPTLFESLAKKAFSFLTNGSNAETIALSNAEKKQIDISRTGADFIYMRILPHSVISNSDPPIKGLNIDGRKSVLGLNSQELFDGSLFTIQNVKSNEVLYLKLLPITFNESQLSFSLQFINFMMDTKETWNILHSQVLFPLFNHIQNGGDALFPSTYATWFNKSFINTTISHEMMANYSNAINFYQVGTLSDQLCASFLLLGLYCHSNCVKDNDLNVVRERTVNYLDALVSVKENFSSYKKDELISSPSMAFESIILRISMALISPFGNKLKFLGLIGNLELPVVTTASYLYSRNSQHSKQSITVNLDDVSSPSPPIIIDDDRLEGVFLKLNKKIQEGIVFANDNCIRESQTVYTDKNDEKKNSIIIRVKKFDAILQIIPIYNHKLPTVNDFTKLYQYYNELKKNLTVKIDADLISIAQNLLLSNNYFVSSLDDSKLKQTFPSISTEALRYRISCHIAAIMRDGISIQMQNIQGASPGFCSLQHSLGSVVINKRSKFSNSNNYNVNDRITLSKDHEDNLFGMLPEFLLKQFENGDTDYSVFFTKFLRLIESVPMRLRANAPTKMTNYVKLSSSGNSGGSDNKSSATQTNDQDQEDASSNNSSSQSASISTSNAGSPQLNLFSSSSYVITKYLRTAQNKLFEEKKGLFIPRKDATDKHSLDAFEGFGSLLGLRFVSGRSPPLPVSRLVLKAAFGGEITQDDVTDCEFNLEELPSIQKQLEAIQIGVELAVPGASNIVPSDTFSRVFQIAPRFKKTVLNIALPEELDDPVYFPSLRRAILFSHVKFQPEDKQKKIVMEIFKIPSEKPKSPTTTSSTVLNIKC